MNNLQKFWELVLDVWDKGVFGVDLGRIATALFILLGFLILRRLVTRFLLKRIVSWAGRSTNKFDDMIVEALEKPLGWVPVILGLFIAIEYVHLVEPMAAIAENGLRSFVAIIFFWAFFNIAGHLSFLLSRLERIFTKPMVEWLLKIIKGAIVFLGAAAVLDIWGIRIGPLLAGLGLFGVAVALGAQDLIKNLIAGMLILAERRFEPGDWIRVDGVVEGTVETIGFRSTLIRRFDLAPVHIPNGQLSDGAVINFSRMTNRRIYWMIGVEYRTTVAQLREIRDEIEKYVTSNGDFMPPEEATSFVCIDSFSESSIDIMLYCFTRTTKWGEWLKIKEALAYKIKEIVEDAGASFAFPSQTLYIENVPREEPESFAPPQSRPSA